MNFTFHMILYLEPSLSRLRRGTTPVLPTSSVFDIPDNYSQTLGGKQFLLNDTLIRNKRMLTFANDLQLVILFKSKHIFIDGTFSVCPPFFDQVFTIHGVHHEHGEFFPYSLINASKMFLFVVVPCVIALLPGRSATVYKRLFELLDEQATDLGMTFEPELITSDFETGLIKTVKQHVCSFSSDLEIDLLFSLYILQFPMARHIGCYFHYTQSIHRKIQTLGLSTVYKDDERARSICHKLMALALLPLNKVESAFQSLAEDHPDSLVILSLV
jgi:hypothetical protein